MGNTALWIAIAGVVIGLPNPASAQGIRDFHVNLKLNRDSTLRVVETITRDFGAEQRHGIERRIPVGALRLRVGDVDDGQGRRYRVQVRRDGRYLVIRIGDKDRLVSGVMNYRITYDVARVIHYLDQRDELYWNVTGNEWGMPIQRASCRVELPEGTHSWQVQYKTFTGEAGATTTGAAVWLQDNGFTATTASLRARQGLTIVVGLPKGVLQPPGRFQRLEWFLLDNILLLPLLLLALGRMSYLYLRRGRDPGDGSGSRGSYGGEDDGGSSGGGSGGGGGSDW